MLDGEVVKEIRDFLEWVVELWVGTTCLGVMGLAAAYST
jgi:hypothetical protein